MISQVAKGSHKRLDYHAVHFLADNTILESFEFRSICICPCQAVICEYANNFICPRPKILIYKIAEYFLLIDDTLTLIFIFVLSG